MPLWLPKLLVDESLPLREVGAIFPACELVTCPNQTLDPAVVVTAREQNAVIVCSDKDFYGAVQRKWINGQSHAFGAFRAVHVPGHWEEAEPVLQAWKGGVIPVIQALAPNFDDCLLIKLGPYSMHIISPYVGVRQVER